jgi:hypothetical protein
MPLDGVITEIIERTRAESRLPAGFRAHFLPEHIDAMERLIGHGVAASIAVGPALSAAYSASEVLLVLLRDQCPSWRAPIALPQVLVCEALQPNHRVVDYRELFLSRT